MNATTHHMHSPISPYTQQSKSSFSAPHHRYPASPAMSPPRQQPSARGLGLYPVVSMAPSHQPSVSPLVASPQSESWSQAPPMEGEYTTAQPSDILSAAFDPFSGFPASSSGMVGPQSPEAPGLEFCQTPPSSNLQSHRGSVSSYAPSDGSDRAYTPRGRPEDAAEWYSTAASEHVLQRASTQSSIPYTPSSTLPSQTEDIYRPHPEEVFRPSQATAWSKGNTEAYISELHASPDGRLPRFEMNPLLPNMARIKKKRQRTTPEEATHDCKVCGKLFKRSYNWKSHMETHNPDRKYPHPCTATMGDQPCTKKFQRKTDLDRHFDSVSLSPRSKCAYSLNPTSRST